MQRYQQLADQLLPQLSYIQGRADTFKNISRLKFTSEFNGKVQNVTTDIHEQLHNLRAQTSESLKPNLEELAPELLGNYSQYSNRPRSDSQENFSVRKQ